MRFDVQTIHIPNSVVGLLIGKAGENIKLLQSRTGCNIQVTRDTDMAPGTNMRPVHLIGNPQQVEAAKAEINIIVTAQVAKDAANGSGPDRPGGGGGGGGGGSGSGVSTATMKVPNANVGIVIGKGGENIRALQMKTGARIQMSRDQGAAEREVTMTGSAQQIEMAKYEITNLIGMASQGRGPVNVQFGGHYQPPMNGGGGGYGHGGGGGGGYGDPYNQHAATYGQDPAYAQWMAYYAQQQQQQAGAPPGAPTGAPGGPDAAAGGAAPGGAAGTAPTAAAGGAGAGAGGAGGAAAGLSPYPPTMDFTSPECTYERDSCLFTGNGITEYNVRCAICDVMCVLCCRLCVVLRSNGGDEWR